MTQKRNDGGPAFCHKVASEDANGRPLRTYETETDNGMTLRDWFAGQALVSIEAWSPTVHGGPHGGRAYDLDTDAARQARARWAYAQADAMIAERDK